MCYGSWEMFGAVLFPVLHMNTLLTYNITLQINYFSVKSHVQKSDKYHCCTIMTTSSSVCFNTLGNWDIMEYYVRENSSKYHFPNKIYFQSFNFRKLRAFFLLLTLMARHITGSIGVQLSCFYVVM